MTTTQVSSVREFYSALSTATANDIIELEPGTYDEIGIWRGLDFDIGFDGTVTIRSADTDNPATLTRLAVNGAANLTFDNLIFDYDAARGAKVQDRPFEIKNSRDIVINGSVFDGDLASGVGARADGYGTGLGLSVRNSRDITVEDNEFHTFYKALSFGGGTGYVARGNDIHSIRADGMTVTKAQDVLIEGNHIHDFTRNLAAGDHADFIQFWTYGNNAPITDITIRGNRLDIGGGDHTQSILMGNESVNVQNGGTRMFYQRITIEDNLILNAHLNGIFIGAANDLTLHNNMLLHADGAVPRNDGHRELPSVRLDERSTNVTLTDNTAVRFTEVDGWTMSGNADVQTLFPDRQGYYVDSDSYLQSSGWTIGSGDTDVRPKDPVDTDNGGPDVVTTDQTGVTRPPVPVEYDFSDGYSANFAALARSDGMRGDARYDAATGSMVLDGSGSVLNLGKMEDYRDTDALTMHMTYVLDGSGVGSLVNNHMRLAVFTGEDTLVLRVATRDESLKRYDIDGLDLAVGQTHQLTVALDRDNDRLQVVLNDEIVLDDTGTDFVHHEELHNWGWTLGNPWQRSVESTISAFDLSDRAQFRPETASQAFETAAVLSGFETDIL